MPNDRNRNDKVAPNEIQKHLGGLDYPADKQQLVRTAKDQNAPQEVLRTIERLPDQKYGSPADVMQAYGKIE